MEPLSPPSNIPDSLGGLGAGYRVSVYPPLTWSMIVWAWTLIGPDSFDTGSFPIPEAVLRGHEIHCAGKDKLNKVVVCRQATQRHLSQDTQETA